jgi:hypothetical protein
MFITAIGAKVQDGRQVQGQVRQRLVIQRRGKGIGWQSGPGAGRVVTRLGLRVRTGKAQNQDDEKRETWEKQELIQKRLVDLTNWQQTENTGVSTQGIMGKMRDTWRGGIGIDKHKDT